EVDPQCREAAAWALGSLGREGQEAAAALLYHEDLDVRGLACLALEAAKEAEAEKAAEMLISWLQEAGATEVSLRVRAVQALGKLRVAKSRRLLAATAADADPSLREASVLALGRLGLQRDSDSDCDFLLVAALDDAEASVREAAACALAMRAKSTATA
ncbi:unnamed protein product, partial [Symbiodinium pilosum]